MITLSLSVTHVARTQRVFSPVIRRTASTSPVRPGTMPHYHVPCPVSDLSSAVPRERRRVSGSDSNDRGVCTSAI